MSGAVDEDVAWTVADGRAALGGVLSTAQQHLQKVFIAFVLGLLVTIYVMWAFVWNQMREDLVSRTPAKVVSVTPFDVILLQVKIGIFVGIVTAIPVLVYYSRDSLRARGIWPTDVSRWKVAVVGLGSVGLMVLGAVYGYFVFFPLAFEFLANNAANAGLNPTYSIVRWAQFILLLTLSFGLAAQLPLVMPALAYAGIVPYEVFRDYWRHAILLLYAFGALFTPPDPLTQVMWATPLVGLYAISLGITRFVVTAKASSEMVDGRQVVREHWNLIAGVAVVAGGLTYVAGNALVGGAADPYLSRVGVTLGDEAGVAGVAAPTVVLVVAVLVAAVAALVTYINRLFAALGDLPDPGARGAAAASAGGPADIDLRELDEAGIYAAPMEAFVDLEEDQALAIAGDAMENDDPDKAQAVLDRFDEAQAAATAGNVAGGDAGQPAEEEGNVVTSTAAGMMDAFTEDETTEDDVGGYYYDVAFILDSLTSRAFRLVGVFMAVMAITFGWFYTGGIGALREQFVAQLPPGVVSDQVEIVALGPVEHLVFMIKVSVIAGFVAVLPMLLYYAWPALKERGLARGNRNALFVWAGGVFASMVAGSIVGFLYVAPAVISWLAADVVQANMVIAYRISNFGWLVVFTTIGVGALFTIPVSMVLFHRGGLVPYRAMRDRWRVVTIVVFAAIAFFSPRGVFMMFLLGIPTMFAYAVGLAIIWAYTLGGRREPGLRWSVD